MLSSSEVGRVRSPRILSARAIARLSASCRPLEVCFRRSTCLLSKNYWLSQINFRRCFLDRAVSRNWQKGALFPGEKCRKSGQMGSGTVCPELWYEFPLLLSNSSVHEYGGGSFLPTENGVIFTTVEGLYEQKSADSQPIQLANGAERTFRFETHF